jgi:hypothetical protein
LSVCWEDVDRGGNVTATTLAPPSSEKDETVDAPVEALPHRGRPLAIAAAASLSAGAIHAAAIGAHAEHPQAARVFTGVAAFQLGWGALALAKPGKRVAYIGAVGNIALFSGWVLAKTKGLNFISGLEDAEPVQFADGLCAALALLSALAAAYAYIGAARRARAGASGRVHRGHPIVAGAAVSLLAFSAVPGMVQAGRHAHAGQAHDESIVVTADGDATVVQNATAVVPPKPYDPNKPIDLGGVEGVTPEQQARAENLIAITLIRLPKWSDPATASAAGFYSIGDGITGYEHYVNWTYINDDKTLDPDHPESLVYRVSGGTKTLEAAMYMLPTGSTLETVPDVGGPLTQWHIHNNLCFTDGPPAPRVAGLTDAQGNCPAPLVKLDPVPMIHVWIVPQACGPFAALEGVGGGQILPGEERLCDHVHGSGTSGF